MPTLSPGQGATPPKPVPGSSELRHFLFTPEAIYVSVNGTRMTLRKNEGSYHAFLALGLDAASHYLRKTVPPIASPKPQGLLSRIFRGKREAQPLPAPVMAAPALPGQQAPAIQVPVLDKIGVSNGNLQVNWGDGLVVDTPITEEAIRPMIEDLQLCYLELRALGTQKVAGVDGKAPRVVTKRSLLRHLKPSPPAEVEAAAIAAAAAAAPRAPVVRSIGEPEKPAAPRELRNDKGFFGGILMAHGIAPWNFDATQKQNYYVKIKLPDGTEKCHWAVDLERGIEDSGAKIGDIISGTNLGKKDVTIQVPVADSSGNVVRHIPKTIQNRTVWELNVVEKAPQMRAAPGRPEITHATVAMQPASTNAALIDWDGLNSHAAAQSPETQPEAGVSWEDAISRQASPPAAATEQPKVAESTPAAVTSPPPVQPLASIPVVPEVPMVAAAPAAEEPAPSAPQQPRTLMLMKLAADQPAAKLGGPNMLHIERDDDGYRYGVHIDQETQDGLRPLLLQSRVQRIAFKPKRDGASPQEARAVESVLLAGATEPTSWPLEPAPSNGRRFTPGKTPVTLNIAARVAATPPAAPVPEIPAPKMEAPETHEPGIGGL